MKSKDRDMVVGDGGRRGVISDLECNLIIMLLPLKMSRLPWESIISEAIMSFTAHEERSH